MATSTTPTIARTRANRLRATTATATAARRTSTVGATVGDTAGNFLGHPNMGSSDIPLVALSPVDGEVLRSTLIGGTGGDAGVGVAVDSSGHVHVAAYTGSNLGGNPAGDLDAAVIRVCEW